jgi:hypothetical protein
LYCRHSAKKFWTAKVDLYSEIQKERIKIKAQALAAKRVVSVGDVILWFRECLFAKKKSV